MKKIQTATFGVPELEMVFISKYSPRIDSKLMLKLLRIKQDTGQPIVRIVNKAIKQYVKGVR